MISKLNDDVFFGNIEEEKINDRLLIESNDDNMTIIVDKINELIENINKIIDRVDDLDRGEVILGGVNG